MMLMLSTQYPYWEREQDEQRLIAAYELYAELLADLPSGALKSATLLHISESRFFPTIAELRQRALDLTSPPIPSALEAWDAATSGKGSPLARRILSLLGFDSFALRVADWQTLSVARSHFVREYDQQVSREETERRLLPQVAEAREKLLKPPLPEIAGPTHEPPALSSPVSRDEARQSLAALRERLEAEQEEKQRAQEQAEKERQEARRKELKEQAQWLSEQEKSKSETMH